MTDPEPLRAIRRRLRDGHQKLFDLQAQQISLLCDTLQALKRAHDELEALIQDDNDLDDLADEEPPR